MVLIAVSFVIALIFKMFYLYLKAKKEGTKITVKQVVIRLIGCGMVVGFAFMLRQFIDRYQLTGPFAGSFVLSVVIPAVIFLWCRKKPQFFRKWEAQAMELLGYLLILILITPILGY